MITGLSQGMLDGDMTSSTWRAMKATRAALFGVMPRIGGRVPPPFLLREKRLLQEHEGEAVPRLVLEAPVTLEGAKGVSSAAPWWRIEQETG